MLFKWIGSFAGLGFVLFLCLFYLQRIRSQRGIRLGKNRIGFYPSSAAMGNAFQTLQALAEPEVQHVLEEKLQEEAEEDDAGDPDDPAAQLERQLKRIRNGEKVDRLTVKLR